MPKLARVLIIVLLIGGIGGGVWFYNHHEAPKNAEL